jgi:hypothetical protein
MKPMYDLAKLYEELPTHPVQLWIKSQHEKKAQAYWDEITNMRRNQTEPKEDNWVTIVDAMTVFRVSYETIRRWTRTGPVRAKKEKGRVWVELNDLHLFHNKKIAVK